MIVEVWIVALLAVSLILTLTLVVYVYWLVGRVGLDVVAIEHHLARYRRDCEAHRDVADLRDRRLAILERRVHDHEVALSAVTADMHVQSGKVDGGL